MDSTMQSAKMQIPAIFLLENIVNVAFSNRQKTNYKLLQFINKMKNDKHEECG